MFDYDFKKITTWLLIYIKVFISNEKICLKGETKLSEMFLRELRNLEQLKISVKFLFIVNIVIFQI